MVISAGRKASTKQYPWRWAVPRVPGQVQRRRTRPARTTGWGRPCWRCRRRTGRRRRKHVTRPGLAFPSGRSRTTWAWPSAGWACLDRQARPSPRAQHLNRPAALHRGQQASPRRLGCSPAGEGGTPAHRPHRQASPALPSADGMAGRCQADRPKCSCVEKPKEARSCTTFWPTRPSRPASTAHWGCTTKVRQLRHAGLRGRGQGAGSTGAVRPGIRRPRPLPAGSLPPPGGRATRGGQHVQGRPGRAGGAQEEGGRGAEEPGCPPAGPEGTLPADRPGPAAGLHRPVALLPGLFPGRGGQFAGPWLPSPR